jgi:hypothetical protein
MSEGSELKLPGFISESEVLPPGRNLALRLLALLIGLGLLVGIAVAGSAAVLTVIWPDRIGMCDASAGSCSDLTIQQIASFSGIDLPESGRIDQAQYALVDNAGLLYATIVLVEGAPDPLRSGDYRVAATLPWAAEVDVLSLDNVVLYEVVRPDTLDGSGAASGQRADGRTVILIRVSRTT